MSQSFQWQCGVAQLRGSVERPPSARNAFYSLLHLQTAHRAWQSRPALAGARCGLLVHASTGWRFFRTLLYVDTFGFRLLRSAKSCVCRLAWFCIGIFVHI